MDNLPPLLKDFIRAIAPAPDRGPLTELQDRYADRQQEARRQLLASSAVNFPHDSVEFMVEMRIREWVKRMERERREIEARKDHADSPKSPQNPPPGNKIAPPKP
jgi:hypothetical protein